MRRKHVLSAEGSKAPMGLERRVLQGPCPGLDLELSGHQGSHGAGNHECRAWPCTLASVLWCLSSHRAQQRPHSLTCFSKPQTPGLEGRVGPGGKKPLGHWVPPSAYRQLRERSRWPVATPAASASEGARGRGGS